jgi:hypothetical protein
MQTGADRTPLKFVTLQVSIITMMLRDQLHRVPASMHKASHGGVTSELGLEFVMLLIR